MCNWAMRTAHRIVLFLVCMAAISGCSSAEQSRPSSSSTATSSGEFINGGPCPESDLGGLGDDVGCVTTAHSDDETLFVYAIVDGDSLPKRWRIRYETDASEIDQPLDAGNPFSYPRALAAIDVNDDSTDEWLIKSVDLAGHGTNCQRLQIFIPDDEGLNPVIYEGEPLFANVGGTSRLGEGARCEDGHLVLLRTEAENRINTIWSYSERVLDITGARAEFITRREGRLRLKDYNDPDLDPYYRLECGGFLYP